MNGVKVIGAVALAAVLFVACGGGSSAPGTPVQTSAPAEDTATTQEPARDPFTCPVDESICDFALDVEAALKRGDASSWLGFVSSSQGQPPILDDGRPATAAILGLLAARSPGQTAPSVRLQGIACLEGDDCAASVVLTFASYAEGDEESGRAGVAVLGFTYGDGEPVLAGLNLDDEVPEVLFTGGSTSDCETVELVSLRCEGSLTAFAFRREGPPPRDTALGHEATQLTVGSDLEFPADTSILVGISGSGHGHGGYFDIVRFTRKGNGPVTRTVVWSGQGEAVPEGSNVTGIEAGADGALWLSRCIGDECHLEGGSHEKDVYTEFHRSFDGGASWEKVAERDGEWYVRGTVGADAFAIAWGAEGEQWIRLPSLEPVSVPANVAEIAPPLDWNRWLMWPASDSAALISADGTSGVTLRLDAAAGPLRIDDVRQLAGNPGVFVATVSAFTEISGYREFVNRYAVRLESVFEEGPKVRQLLRLDGNFVHLGPFLDESTMLVTAEYSRETGCFHDGPESGAIPAVLDFENGSLRFIGDPFFCEAGAVEVISALQGPFHTVATPEDCLNLREAPGVGARVITCLGHGALVRPTDQKAEADGQQWLRVTIEGGRSGWVASEFVVP